jgi:Rrf2 family protein
MALLQRRTMYALEALVYMANGDGRFVTVADIAKDLKLPKPFLRSTFQVLARYGVVESRKGPAGGFRFLSPSNKMTLHSVVLAIQGHLIVAPSIGKKGKGHQSLIVLQQEIEKLLKGISIAGLANDL